MTETIVGGGAKKVLYTLSTVKRIGLKQSAKALNSRNACKACGLGMGGQRGGMTNELDEFPAVCNKSIQAQSTDIQSPIPSEIFRHSLDDLRELSAHELEHLGRLNSPLFKAKEANRYYEADWEWALKYAAERFAQTKPEKSFFYSSGRSSNESGFVLQLLARLYGTNNVNNCSYYCHQATSVGLGTTIGTGTATVELNDLTQCDLVFVIGANPSSNHPRFIHQLKACRDRGGKVIVINPAKEPGLVKFAVPKSPRSMISGGTEIASRYVQPHIGSDIAVFKGIAKAVLEQEGQDKAFISQYCESAEAFIEDIETTPWEDIEQLSGIDRNELLDVAMDYCHSKRTVFAWGMGITHHQHGSENVEYIANLALLRGMVGKVGAGLLPLRGHSNVQGIGTIGVKPVLSAEVFQKMEDELNVSLPQAQGLDTFNALKQAAEGKIDCACIVGGNLYSATPDSRWAAQALNRIGFKVFLTTTLNQGHLHGVEDSDVLILPVAARDEETQPTTQESMFSYVRMSDGGIDRLDNVRSEVSILADIGQHLLAETSPKLSIDFTEFKRHRTVRETIARIIPGMEPLKDIDVARQEFHISQRQLHAPEFNTASGKARFIVHTIDNAQSKEDYPFVLASVRSEGQFNSIIYEETDSYRHQASRHSLLMSPEDLSYLGLKQGDKISVISRQGRMDNLLVQPFDIPAGNVLAYYPEANVLTEHNVDPRSKTPNFKSVPVKIIV